MAKWLRWLLVAAPAFLWGLFIALASVSPEDATSNLTKWARVVGRQRWPAWLSGAPGLSLATLAMAGVTFYLLRATQKARREADGALRELATAAAFQRELATRPSKSVEGVRIGEFTAALLRDQWGLGLPPARAEEITFPAQWTPDDPSRPWSRDFAGGMLCPANPSGEHMSLSFTGDILPAGVTLGELCVDVCDRKSLSRSILEITFARYALNGTGSILGSAKSARTGSGELLCISLNSRATAGNTYTLRAVIIPNGPVEAGDYRLGAVRARYV